MLGWLLQRFLWRKVQNTRPTYRWELKADVPTERPPEAIPAAVLEVTARASLADVVGWDDGGYGDWLLEERRFSDYVDLTDPALRAVEQHALVLAQTKDLEFVGAHSKPPAT